MKVLCIATLMCCVIFHAIYVVSSKGNTVENFYYVKYSSQSYFELRCFIVICAGRKLGKIYNVRVDICQNYTNNFKNYNYF